MSFAICGKRLLTEIKMAQSNPKAITLNETIYAILADSESYLQREITPSFRDGVPARVAIKRPPFNCNTGADCSTALCDTPGVATQKPTWETFDIEDCITTKDPYSIDPTDYEQACNGTLTQGFIDAVEMAIDELKRGLNNRAIAFLKANVGTWVDGSLTKELPISAATTGVGLYPTWREIQRQFASVGITTKPNVLGGAPIYQIMPVFTASNPLAGFNAATAGGVTMYYEPEFDSVLATPANRIISWSPQTVQIVTYSKYLGGFSQGTGVAGIADVEKVWKEARVRTTGVIPFLFYSNLSDAGAPIRVYADFEGIPDDCGGFKFTLKIQYKFLTVLTDLCNAGGFNGIISMTTCQPVTPACPDEPTPPADPTIYCMAWEGVPCENPYTVNSVTIGGRTFTGIPMTYTTTASLVTIINTFVGSDIVYLEDGVVHTLLPIADGSLNEGAYTFTFTDCAGS